MKRGLCNNAVQGYEALTTKSIRSIIAFTISLIIASKSKLITSFQRLKLTLEGRHPLRQTSAIILSILPLIFISCAKPIVEIQTQEVFIPIKCNLSLPIKPQETGTFENHKALVKYYLEVEQIAKDCTNE